MLYLIFVGSWPPQHGGYERHRDCRETPWRGEMMRSLPHWHRSCGRDNGFGQAAEAMNTDYNDEPRPEDQSIIKSSWYDLFICDKVFGSLFLKATYLYKYIFTHTCVYIYIYTYVIQHTVCMQSYLKGLCTTKPALCIENFHCVNLHIPDLKQIQSHMVQFPLALNWHHWSVRLVGHTVLISWYMLICFKCLDEAWIPNQLCLVLV